MNFGLKSVSYNAPLYGSPALQSNVALSSLIGASGRLVGIVAVTKIAADAATVLLTYITSPFDLVNELVSLNVTQAAGVTSCRAWWAGLTNQHKDHAVEGVVAANTVNGFFPIAPPCTWKDVNAASPNGYSAPLNITIALTGGATVTLFYTEDGPNNAGEHA